MSPRKKPTILDDDDDEEGDSHHPFVPPDADAEESMELVAPSPQVEEKEVTYWSLLRDNPKYRLYLASYMTNYVGEWLTYLSSLSAMQEMLSAASEDHEAGDQDQQINKLVSYLVVVRLMTCVMVAPLGGVLADGWDRRMVMIVLDVMGAAVAWLFVAAVTTNPSVVLLYGATFLQQLLLGLYEPSRSAILPLLVDNEEAAMEKATLISGMAWSAMAALGSSMGGFLVSWIGIQACFKVDCLTYLLSAVFMYAIGPGQWDVSTAEPAQDAERGHATFSANSLSDKMKHMVWDGILYVYHSAWGPIVFMKFSVLWLTLDVVNVEFAAQSGNGESTSEGEDAFRLGLLFGGVGVGCFVGPLVAERFTLMEQPDTLQAACIASVGVAAFGCLAMGYLAPTFGWLCFWTGVRSCGVSAAWINSSLLLQKFSTPQMLGRVSSLDLALALIGESASALLAGRLEDDLGWTPYRVCQGLGFWGGILVAAWAIFHVRGGGGVTADVHQETTTEPLAGNQDDPTHDKPTSAVDKPASAIEMALVSSPDRLNASHHAWACR